ncbi:MAG: hypothetical protein ACFFA6_15250 [Promethearchaeota archaeon]
MTHSLHRKGSIKDLKNDYVVLACLAKGINREIPEGRKKMIRIAEILKENNPVNIIPKFTWKISPVITAVYSDINIIKKILKTLKKEDLGISIVVSGLISEIQDILHNIDLKIHTAHLSLGTFGNKKLLPVRESVLEVTTMCGHHCISPQSVDHYIKQIKQGKVTVEKAIERLAKPCICGIFNKKRTEEILKKIINLEL